MFSLCSAYISKPAFSQTTTSMFFAMHVRRTRGSRYKLKQERLGPGKRENSFIMKTAQEQVDVKAEPALNRRLN